MHFLSHLFLVLILQFLPLICEFPVPHSLIRFVTKFYSLALFLSSLLTLYSAFLIPKLYYYIYLIHLPIFHYALLMSLIVILIH
uniref:Uncharacterized protein n=1 Tax=Panstrongylus lignarius TaxID=156445 RepID=A0A224XSD4_9HEMI